MRNNWEVATLSDVSFVTDFSANGSFAGLRENVKYIYQPDYAILLRLVDFNRNWDGDFVYIPKHSYDFLKKCQLDPGDVIIANIGANAGTLFRAPDLCKPSALGPNALVIKTHNYPNTSKEYLYYYFISPAGQNQIQSLISGSAQPKFTKTDIRNLKIPFPPLPEQRAIAGILGDLDEKIDVNRRMNTTLESVAQAVFRKWFVENEEAISWEETPLDEIANFLNGLALQKFPPEGNEFLPVIKIAQMRKTNTEGADKASTNIPPQYIIEDGDILFSWSGSLEVVVWCGGKGALNQHLFKVSSDKYPKWFYYYWTKYHLLDFQEIAAGKATTMGHIQRYHLSAAKVFVPNDDKLHEMDRHMSPLLQRIIVNNLESRTLASLRDSLLPKLMRGEVRVKGG